MASDRLCSTHRIVPRPPIALFALQAPTLLTLLANTTRWDLRTEPMGDHEGLAEAAQNTRPGLGGDAPDVIFVCSPAQLTAAEALLVTLQRPKTPIVWVVHNGTESALTAGWQGPALAFSTANIHAHAPSGRFGFFVIRPHVPVAPLDPNVLPSRPRFWTMRNRPHTRDMQQAMRTAALDRCIDEAGVRDRYAIFGQGQPGGYLEPNRRDHLLRGSLAYVSAVPLCGGFGLAEHEALASGCPLLAWAWGDTPITLAGYEGLVHTLSHMTEMLRSAEWERPSTRPRLAEAGWDALRTHYTQAIMDRGIAELLDALL